jgi:subtilisin family serine protease
MNSYATMRFALAAALWLGSVFVSHAQVSPQLAQKAPEANAIAAAAQQSGYVRVIVEFAAPGVTTELRPDADFLAPIKAQIASLQDAIIASHFSNATNPNEGQGFSRNLVRFEIRPLFAVNVSLAELEALAADPQIVFIQYDRPQPPTLNQSVPLVGMPAVYAAGGTGVRQAVAILDTGVQANHQFLSGNMLLEACFSSGGVSLCPNGQTSQVGPGASDPTTAQCINGAATLCNHGTHVAGIAAGNNTNPGEGNPDNGVAKGAKIISIQVFSRYNNEWDCGTGNSPCVLTSPSDQIRALDWLFLNALVPATGIRLAAVNMSLGSGEYFAACDSDQRKPSIDTLRGVGVVTVIASGNDGFRNAVGIPACISTAVAVGSSTKQNVISSFSNMSSLVKLMAPGGFGTSPCAPGANNANILSSISGTSSAQNDLYNCFAGTSMAAPHVAGAFAAIRTLCANATIDRILAALQKTGISIADTRPGGTQTKPRIAVDLARQSLGCASHDFNGDGKSDIVWRNTSGTIAIWLMNGATLSSSAASAGCPPPGRSSGSATSTATAWPISCGATTSATPKSGS